MVGAGPTGLTVACELARRGVAVRVVDGAAGPFPGSRGKGLQPRTLEVLDGLGVAGRLVSTGSFRIPIRRYGPDGTSRVHDIHAGAEPTPDRPYARPLMIPQWRVEEILRERLVREGVDVEWSTGVRDLTQDDEHVVVSTEDGAKVGARWVVACDGGSSTVRHRLGVPFLGETHEHVRMLVGDVELEGLDRDHWHLWDTLALCPLPATDTFQFQAFGPEEGADPTLSTFRAIAAEAAGNRVHLRRLTWGSTWRLNVRMVDRYRVGRVFLAGDAAHVHSPAGGQGMNTGIQDATNLGWKLAHVLAGADPALLDTYEAERLPIAADVLGLSTRLTTRTFEDRGADGERALQLGVTYRGGPLAPSGSGEGPQAGDRAPDAPLRDAGGAPVTLLDLRRGPHWTLLGFGTHPAQPTGPVRVVGIDAAGGDVGDPGGHAWEAYGAVDGELVLIRPDGHIGIRGTDAAAIVEYLAAVMPSGHLAEAAFLGSSTRARS